MTLKIVFKGSQCATLAALFTILLIASSTLAQSTTQTTNKRSTQNPLATADSSVEVVDLTPRFLKFYETAIAEKADPERRWQLWQQLYGFAAVPPTPEAKGMARALLDHAWPEYPKYIDRIRSGAAVLKPSPQSVLESVVKLLGFQGAIKVKVIVFVGGLENNPFAYVDDGVPAVAIPVESSDKDLLLYMTHEFTHAVHSKIAGPASDHTKIASVAQLVLSEGLAMRVTEKLVPGQTPEIYTNAHGDEWLRQAQERRTAILKGIQQHLDESNSEAYTRFLFGTGTTGLAREAYYAGWLVVGEMERQGISLAEIARVPRESVSDAINSVINSLTGVDDSKKRIKVSLRGTDFRGNSRMQTIIPFRSLRFTEATGSSMKLSLESKSTCISHTGDGVFCVRESF